MAPRETLASSRHSINSCWPNCACPNSSSSQSCVEPLRPRPRLLCHLSPLRDIPRSFRSLSFSLARCLCPTFRFTINGLPGNGPSFFSRVRSLEARQLARFEEERVTILNLSASSANCPRHCICLCHPGVSSLTCLDGLLPSPSLDPHALWAHPDTLSRFSCLPLPLPVSTAHLLLTTNKGP